MFSSNMAQDTEPNNFKLSSIKYETMMLWILKQIPFYNGLTFLIKISGFNDKLIMCVSHR